MDINYSAFNVKLLQNPRQYRLLLDGNLITEVEAEFFNDSLDNFLDNSLMETKANSLIIRAWEQLGEILSLYKENQFLSVEGEISIQKLANNEECILQLDNFSPYTNLYS